MQQLIKHPSFTETFLPRNEENDGLKEELCEHFPGMDFYLGGLGHDMNLT